MRTPRVPVAPGSRKAPTKARTRRALATSDPRLTTRALNRALLDRQLLLRRASLSATDALEHLVGLQSQLPDSGYVGLWTRLQRFRPVALAEALTNRDVVRIVLMRGTIHLVTANDALELRPLFQPLLEKMTDGNFRRGLAGLDYDAVARAARALIEPAPRPYVELGKLLQGRWPERKASDLAVLVRTRVPLVQVPPRGLWGQSGQPTVTSAEAWLGRPLAQNPSREKLVLRCLRAFGPATIADVQTWSGLANLREVLEGLRPQLVSFRDEQGRELFDLPDAPRPDPDTPAPPRFLPEYDNLLRSHADRSRVIDEAHHRWIFSAPNGVSPGTVLVDGLVGATWKVERARGGAVLTVTALRPLSPSERAAIAEEGVGLLRFLEVDGERVRFARASSG